MSHPYLDSQYANAFSGLARVEKLSRSDIPMLWRAIDDSDHYDLTSCYPRTPIFSMNTLQADVDALENQACVSATFVSDVFWGLGDKHNDGWFDYIHPFKTHYILDRNRPFQLCKHHRYEVKQSQKNCQVEPVSLRENLSEWMALYQHLIERHHIEGIAAFSEHYFKSISVMPELHAFAARVNGAIVSMHLWFAHEDKLYSHLSATSTIGYQHRASYAIYNHILENEIGFRQIDFGGNSGAIDDANDGLAKFKSGFSNDTVPSYILGKIIDEQAYQTLCDTRSRSNQQYFPLYRS